MSTVGAQQMTDFLVKIPLAELLVGPAHQKGGAGPLWSYRKDE